MFSPFKMRCPECGTPVAVKKEEYIGRKVACKSCEAKFVIKAPSRKSSSGSKKVKQKVKNKSGQDTEFMLALGKLDLTDESQSIKSLPQAPGRKSKARKMQEAKSKAKKTNQNEEKKKESISPVAVIAGSVLSVCLIGGLVFLLKDKISLPGGKMEPPKELAWYSNEDAVFSMQFPKDWEVEGGGGVGGKPLWARAKKGSVTISIRDSLSGSAIGDIAGAGGGGDHYIDENGKVVEIPDEEKAISKIHDFNRLKAEEKYKNYEERNARMLDTSMGEARVADFTSSDIFGTYGGMRATYRTPKYQLTLYCVCNESEYRDMQGVFNKIAMSVRGKRASKDELEGK